MTILSLSPMDSPFPSSLFLWLLIFQVWVFINIPSCSSKGDWYTNCRNNFTCGSLSAAYPFWGDSRPSGCGIPGLELSCDNDTAAITINDVTYRVLEIHSDTRIIRIARKDFLVGICSSLFVNTSLSPPLLDYVDGYDNITLVYGCPTVPGTFSCVVSGSAYATGYIITGASGAGPCYNMQ